MFVMVTDWFPLDKLTEVSKIFVKIAGTLPPILKRVGSPYVTSTEVGIKAYALFEIEDEKLAEGLRGLTNYFMQYNGIVGYRYVIEPLLTAEEILPMVGLTPPK